MMPKTHGSMGGHVEERQAYEHDLWGDRVQFDGELPLVTTGGTVESEEHRGMSRRVIGVRREGIRASAMLYRPGNGAICTEASVGTVDIGS